MGEVGDLKKLLVALVLSMVFTTNALLLIEPDVVLAHPGRTASDGCHFCRTNCDGWGVAWNARHCHGVAVSSKFVPRPTPQIDTDERGMLEKVLWTVVPAAIGVWFLILFVRWFLGYKN